MAHVQATCPRTNWRRLTSVTIFLAHQHPNVTSDNNFHGWPGWNNQRSHHLSIQWCYRHETDSGFHVCLPHGWLLTQIKSDHECRSRWEDDDPTWIGIWYRFWLSGKSNICFRLVSWYRVQTEQRNSYWVRGIRIELERSDEAEEFVLSWMTI